MVMKARLNVLQDEGYVIKTANTDLGLTARREETTPPCVFHETCAMPISWDCNSCAAHFFRLG